MRTILLKVHCEDVDGHRIYEHVLAAQLATGAFRIAATPGMVFGAAAGDVVRLDPVTELLVLEEHGGQLALQVYGDLDHVRSVLPQVLALGGTCDGQHRGLSVFTLPVTAGFGPIGQVFADLCQRHPAVEWYYGNVFDERDRPLYWWGDDTDFAAVWSPDPQTAPESSPPG